ncbi:hypothetical protein EVU96_08570 [Bacillus infantis]|uniref:hypothetical protein n=1 Tax=Bacillus infantis TaxID=324767 RepID=UPI00101E2068|nr:hypothetical protein [Bacillus infantis]RYI30456.1 hypothetical protein EVU96_08570 [Bacillus infantis]
MKYSAKFFTTEKDILEKLGFDPEVSVVKKLDYDSETGEIEVLIHSAKTHDKATEIENGMLVRRFKL